MPSVRGSGFHPVASRRGPPARNPHRIGCAVASVVLLLLAGPGRPSLVAAAPNRRPYQRRFESVALQPKTLAAYARNGLFDRLRPADLDLLIDEAERRGRTRSVGALRCGLALCGAALELAERSPTHDRAQAVSDLAQTYVQLWLDSNGHREAIPAGVGVGGAKGRRRPSPPAMHGALLERLKALASRGHLLSLKTHAALLANADALPDALIRRLRLGVDDLGALPQAEIDTLLAGTDATSGQRAVVLTGQDRPHARDLALATLRRLAGLMDAEPGAARRAVLAGLAHIYDSEGFVDQLVAADARVAQQDRKRWRTLETARQALRIDIGELRAFQSGRSAPPAAGQAPMATPRDSGGLAPDQQALLRSMNAERGGLKRAVFAGSEFVALLEDPQAWITINDPNLARQLVSAITSAELPSAGTAPLLEALRRTVDPEIRELDKLSAEHYRLYADEIIDAVRATASGAGLAAQARIAPLLAGAQGGGPDATIIRYARRTQADLEAGKRTGDCTAPGGINHQRSLTWYYNPAYQVVYASRAGTLAVKLTLALGRVRDQDAIIVDSLEFDPQAAAGLPRNAAGRRALKDTLRWLYGLARKEHRRLFALVRSNSVPANKYLQKIGVPLAASPDEPVVVSVLWPEKEIRAVLAGSPGKSGGRVPYRGRLEPFYQMLDVDALDPTAPDEVMDPRIIASRPLNRRLDDLAARLQKEVFGPIFAGDANLARSLADARSSAPKDQARAFGALARTLNDRPGVEADIKRVAGLDDKATLARSFLANKLVALYGSPDPLASLLSRPLRIQANTLVELRDPPRAGATGQPRRTVKP